ncbi:MAG: hypothetical protein H3Z52_04780 [archaeon]|nr:hypothetical protein [archaeon]MCP8320244.1 hypothetical protein [archaeon]
MEPIEKLNELDRAFDLLLVILGIITSALFQFQSTRLPLEIAALNPGIEQRELFSAVQTQITIWLRIFFIPLILLIAVWFVNRVAFQSRIRVRKSLSEFCYIMCFWILGHDVIYFIGAVIFQPTQITFMPTPLTLIENIFTILISLGLVYSHEIPFIRTEDIKTRKKTLARIWRPILIRALALWLVTLAIVNDITYFSYVLV